MECDLLVLGAGPGGYPAALRATQLGASVVCVEEKWVGGTCLNVGCIPTKAMIQSAHAWHELNGQFKTLGVVAENASIDFDQVQKNRQTIVDNVVKGLGGLMKGAGITMVDGPRHLHRPEHPAGRGWGGDHLQGRDHRDRLPPDPPADPRDRERALHRLDRACSRSRRSRRSS